MAAASQDLVVEQGADWSQPLVWKDDAGVPIDLTGYTARMHVRARVEDAATVLALTEADGIALGGAAGTITLSRTAAQTDAVAAGVYVYDLELASGAGVVERLMKGSLSVSRGVTR